MVDADDEILISGVTGATGAAVLQHVLAAGHRRVRLLVRRPSEKAWPPGVREVVGDFDDPGSVVAALAGVRRAYLVTPSSAGAEQQQVGFAEAAAAGGLDRLVLLSQLGARLDSPVRFLRYHAAVEARVVELGLDHVFLRPNLFFQGLLGLAGTIRATGTLSAPIGSAAVSAVDVADIGAVGATALLEEDVRSDRTWTITGPEAITHAQMAAELSAATGRPIRFEDVAPEAFGTALAPVLPPWQVDGLLEDYAHYGRGEAAGVSPVVEQVTGRPPRSFASFARAHADAF